MEKTDGMEFMRYEEERDSGTDFYLLTLTQEQIRRLREMHISSLQKDLNRLTVEN